MFLFPGLGFDSGGVMLGAGSELCESAAVFFPPERQVHVTHESGGK